MLVIIIVNSMQNFVKTYSKNEGLKIFDHILLFLYCLLQYCYIENIHNNIESLFRTP